LVPAAPPHGRVIVPPMVEVTMVTQQGAPCIRLHGTGDGPVLTLVASAVATAIRTDGVRLVDVTDLSMIDLSGVQAFLAELYDEVEADDVTLVCARLTGRRILRRYGGDDARIAIDVEQALDAFATA